MLLSESFSFGLINLVEKLCIIKPRMEPGHLRCKNAFNSKGKHGINNIEVLFNREIQILKTFCVKDNTVKRDYLAPLISLQQIKMAYKCRLLPAWRHHNAWYATGDHYIDRRNIDINLILNLCGRQGHKYKTIISNNTEQ